MADRRSDWVEILEPRSRELMYINLSTGECGWEPPPDVPVRQSDGNQWWELYDRSSSRFYYYNCTNQQTVWHRPENCDVVPLAQLQAMKKSSEAELRTDVRIHKAGSGSSTQSSSLEQDSGRATPSSQGKRDSLEGRETGQRWQPAPGSKAAMLVKIDSTCKKPSPGPVSSHFKPTGISHTSRNPSKPDRSALLKKMSVPVDFKQILPVTGNFATVLPSSAAPNKRPSSPQYGATPSAPIYDEPPTAEPPIYDEPPQEMEAEGCHRSLLPTSLAPKLLQHPNTKAICSNNEYSPAGRECIKHMVNVEAPAPKSDGGSISALCRAQTQSGRIKTEVPLEKKHSWRLLEPRHSRQSSFTSQEYPSPAVVTYQDSGYSTGPSPSLRRKNRRRAPMGSGSGRPGSVGSNGELSALNEMLMAEMRSVVKRSSVLDGSKASLDTEMGSEAWESSARSPLSGSQEDVAQSSRSVFRSHGDVVLSPLVMDALSCRQKRTFEKVDSLEKIPTQTRLSSPDLPRVSSQTGTLDSGQEMANQDRDRTSRITHIIHSSRPPPLLSTYQYPYHTLCKPPVDANIEDWASKNLNQHTQGLFRRRVSITNMLSWNRSSIKKPMLITSDRAVKKESCEMFKLVQAYMGDRSGRLDKRHSALQVVTKCWGTQALRDELYVQLVRQTTDNWSLRSLEAGWELMAISLAFFSPSPKFRHYLEGYIQRHLDPGQDEKLLQQIVQQQDMKSKKNSRSMKKRRQSDEDVEDLKLPISTYAKYCYRKLQKVAITGGKKGLRKPTLEEIDQGRNAIVTPSLFGSALEEIMERQNQLFPDRKLPWVQVQLSQYVLALGGARAEGIFRVPGDIDEVNALKLQVEQWRIPENLSDPNVPASLLKLWYRELEEPVIPQSFYKQCVAHYEDPDAAVAVVQDLPELNRLVLCYFIHFLQVFAQPANVSRTKMDVNNLAMVMAPNCLRCQSDDPRVIFENTRKEMSFLRILVVHLDTSFITGVM